MSETTLSNFRVEYHAPDPAQGHTFEPYCAILADSEFFQVVVASDVKTRPCDLRGRREKMMDQRELDNLIARRRQRRPSDNELAQAHRDELGVIFSIRDRNGTRFTVEPQPNQFLAEIINYRLVIEPRGKDESYFYANREQYQAFIQSEYERLFGKERAAVTV